MAVSLFLVLVTQEEFTFSHERLAEAMKSCNNEELWQTRFSAGYVECENIGGEFW